MDKSTVIGVCLLAGLCMSSGSADAQSDSRRLSVARVYFEFNATANDLGVHVFLDGEDWKSLTISNPDALKIFAVQGKGPYRMLGLTELFFEGAEPSLDEVPLAVLLGLFPAGRYKFSGTSLEGEDVARSARLTHAIPAAPVATATVEKDGGVVISWEEVTGPPPGFPALPITIVGYQVLVGAFQVRVPATTFSLTVSPEFVAALGAGTHSFEVLAIEAGGNQTITEGAFVLP